VAADTSTPHGRRLARICTFIALAAVAFVLGVSWHWGAFAIGGSDSHCYAGQARMFAEGRLALPPPVALPVPWPNGAATFAPSGFAPGPGPDGGSVPLCAGGLALLMAAALTTGGDPAIFLVVPLMGALTVWSTFVLGRRLAGPAVGAASAWLVACSPIFLYQVVQPMSDVPAAALWTASLAVALGVAESRDKYPSAALETDAPRRTASAWRRPAGAWRRTFSTWRKPDSTWRRTSVLRVLAGLLAGTAITMRPNLAPLAVVPLLFALPSRRAVVATVGGLVPGVGVVALLQAAIYGSPLRSGYGDLGQLFSVSHVAANLINYPAWLSLAHSPVLAIGLLAPLIVRRQAAAWLLVAFVLAVVAAYLPYVPFTDWWYTRFLLPGLPVLVVLMVSVLARLARRLPAPGGGVALGLVVLAMGVFWLTRANDLAVFRLKTLERKYVELGRLASTRLPARAIVLGAQPTGSVRYYAHLPTLSWDAIAPDWLDRVLDDCRSRGLVPYFAIESWEVDAFKSRFRGHSAVADLDWPPREVVGSVIFVYDPADRARYLAGEQIPTDRIIWDR
jgi:hypothetical protein